MKIINVPDGSYSLDSKGRTIILTINGVVDIEIALRLMLDIKILVTQKKYTYWASLVDLSGWGLHPPEIVSYMQEFHEWAEKNGQLAEAAVVNKSILKVMARNKLLQGSRNKVHQEYFEDKAEAVEWLQHLSLFDK
jgi:hypothetical protein